jgi:hypothetical protein
MTTFPSFFPLSNRMNACTRTHTYPEPPAAIQHTISQGGKKDGQGTHLRSIIELLDALLELELSVPELLGDGGVELVDVLLLVVGDDEAVDLDRVSNDLAVKRERQGRKGERGAKESLR